MVTPSLNFGSLALEMLLLFSGIFLFLVDHFMKNKNYAFWVSVLTVIASLFILLFIPFGDFTKAFRVDFYSSSIKFLLTIGFFFLLFLSYPYLKTFSALNFGEYYGLLFFSLFGAYVMISSQDFLTLFLGLELMSVSLYFLIASQFLYKRHALEGSLKYFIAGAVSATFYILFLCILYYATGSIYFEEVIKKLSQGHLRGELLVSFVFFLGAFSIKLSLVPFHMWAPDAYESSPLPIVVFLAGIVKFALLAVLIKVLILAFSPLKLELGKLIIPFALFSILIGSLLAIKQDNLVRLLAYSSIAHMGFAVLGLTSGEFSGYGFSLFYMFVYLFTTIGTFALLIYFIKINTHLLNINNLAGISKDFPLCSFLFLIFLFSLAGIPPTGGFMAKFYIFVMLIKAKYIAVALLALLISVIGAYPYLRVIKVLYMDEGLIHYKKKSFSILLTLTLIVATFITLLLGIYPKPLLDFIQRTLFLYLSLQFFQF
ncbi:MAG: NADH-quinone oxidoreductase subunit N [Caldimicrobium sp.]|nr:NADH-quinone oxidoreductase subunit N [Caldimicrobium sp.]MCX7874263.1 NADH-quinone oxidoreductase subunit N [Caldimicrobium sp.]MDW8093930.1 NADH-quinone oxidoreductase subunit N [Caldimicrobium sp.]